MKAKYYLYRNLHTGGFSIKHKGIVCARGDTFIMKNVEFRVGLAGKNRVMNEKRKNVHAYMVADSFEIDTNISIKDTAEMIRVTYNPYKYKTFVDAETEESIKEAEYAIAINGQVFAKCSGS